MAKLGELYKITSGGTPSRTHSEYYEDGTIPWVKTGDLKDKYLFETDEKISQLGLENSSARIYLKNTVLLAMYGATIGATSILKIDAATNQACAAFSPREDTLPEYLYAFLESQKDKFIKDAVGGAQPNLSAGYLKTIEFKLPSLEQQTRITRNLSKIDELLLLRKQQLAKLDELVKARFVEMFGDPINNPMKWIVSKIEDIAAQEKNALKAGPFGSALKKEFYVRSGYKIYGQEQVICGDASFGDYYINEEKYKELKNCAVQAGDILISLVGTYGKTLIMPDNYEAGIINPRLMKITLNKNKVTPIYFKYYFESNALKASMDANTHGGTMGVLNLGIIRQMKIQVPPLSLQNQFAAFVERVDKQKQTVQQSLEKLELMKKALMQEYFG